MVSRGRLYSLRSFTKTMFITFKRRPYGCNGGAKGVVLFAIVLICMSRSLLFAIKNPQKKFFSADFFYGDDNQPFCR